ncbi:Mrp/NBP35 family ATP-binding protein, partial [Halobium palmae]
LGARVGLFDADVYGPNVPRMVAADEAPKATAEETIVPPEKYGVKLMSMAFLVGEDDPVIWRGPMVHKVLTQLTEDVEWGELDYMVLDLPPGTGDTQLTVLQTLPLTGAVVVTTPQDVAVDDARKALEMFGKHETNVLGIAENMAGFRCPDCGSTHDIFGTGGGQALADESNMPYLGGIPLDPEVRAGGGDVLVHSRRRHAASTEPLVTGAAVPVPGESPERSRGRHRLTLGGRRSYIPARHAVTGSGRARGRNPEEPPQPTGEHDRRARGGR